MPLIVIRVSTPVESFGCFVSSAKFLTKSKLQPSQLLRKNRRLVSVPILWITFRIYSYHQPSRNRQKHLSDNLK
jgi:hypothetical protein